MPQGVGSGFGTCKHNLLLFSYLGDVPIDQKSASVVMVRKVGGISPTWTRESVMQLRYRGLLATEQWLRQTGS